MGERERDLKMNKTSMNEDIKEFSIYALARNGQLVEIDWIKSTDDYNHYYYNLHHFIKKEHYRKNRQWYEERGIKQKLILLPIFIHEQLHNQAIKILSDEDFFARLKIEKSELLFSRKTSNY